MVLKVRENPIIVFFFVIYFLFESPTNIQLIKHIDCGKKTLINLVNVLLFICLAVITEPRYSIMWNWLNISSPRWRRIIFMFSLITWLNFAVHSLHYRTVQYTVGCICYFLCRERTSIASTVRVLPLYSWLQQAAHGKLFHSYFLKVCLVHDYILTLYIYNI